MEVIRIYAHPKYKHRTKSKKKYQAHNTHNQINVILQFEKSRPISKTKTRLAITVVAKNKLKTPEATGARSIIGSSPALFSFWFILSLLLLLHLLVNCG
uniref:Uncharacterized protein n=1 Tax=Nymphaea colorata TaxID=210225 RepID=A0A5K1AWE9_9MAGN